MSETQGTTLHLMVVITLTADSREEFMQALTACIPPTRKEAGCLQYDVFECNDDPNMVFLKEEWASDEALGIHMRTPHLLAVKAVADKHLDGGFMGNAKIYRMHALAGQ